MANNNARDPDEMTPEEREDFYSNMYRGALPRIGGGSALPAAPDIAGTLPTTSQQPAVQATLPGSDTLRNRLEAREKTLTEALSPARKTGWGRVGQVLGTVGQDIGVALAPGAMERIPGTTLNRRMELEEVQKRLGEEQARETRGTLERAQAEEAGTKAQAERMAMGQPTPVPGTEGYNPQTMEPQILWKIPGGGYQLGPMQRMPSAAPVPSEIPGTMPGVQVAPPTPPPQMAVAAPPAAGAPAAAAAAQQPTYVAGKPPEKERRLTPDEIRQGEAGFLDRYQVRNPGKPLPPEFKLPPNATIADYDRIDKALEGVEKAGSAQTAQQSVIEQRKFNEGMRQQEAHRQAEAAKEREEKTNAEWLRAVDNDGKVHYVTRGDYNAHPRDFHPNPGTLAPGAYQTAVDHATAVNDMQARMNAVAESTQNFDWRDKGQRQIVIQAMQHVENSFVDRTIGIPIMDYIRQNLKQLGLAGATPETREYVTDLIWLREAMLSLGKEVTGGSRGMEKQIEALYAGLPAGETPDRAWAMSQLLGAQSVIDRVRGTRVPIIDGLERIDKIPDLYKHSGTNPRTKQRIYSDDLKNWVDENLRPVRQE